MLVFRPQQKVGQYRGFDVLLASNDATQDSKPFDEACKALEDRVMFINDAEKDK